MYTAVHLHRGFFASNADRKVARRSRETRPIEANSDDFAN
jgi:hypothetical protein